MKIQNNTLIDDFRVDITTGQKINFDEFKLILKQKYPKRKSFYIAEMTDLYYKSNYNLNILEIYSQYIDIPRCPINNKVVSYKITGVIIFGKFSSESFGTAMTTYIANNNDNYKKHVENMKINRMGDKNPMYGEPAWNKGLNKFNNEIMKKNSEDRMGIKFSEETLKKQSESDKKRLIHGHTGMKHSEESKQIMREKTIARLKSGKFPQTNTVPHQKFRDLINQIFPNEFEEEFQYGHFSFDFKLNNYLIEIHGDYWHANPNTRHSGATHSVQRVNVSRDRKKANYVLENKKYTLIVFWENEILNQPQYITTCLNKLKQ